MRTRNHRSKIGLMFKGVKDRRDALWLRLLRNQMESWGNNGVTIFFTDFEWKELCNKDSRQEFLNEYKR